jgi:hypothetical protein
MAAAEVVVKRCLEACVYDHAIWRQFSRGLAAMATLACVGAGLGGCASIHLLGNSPAPAAEAIVSDGTTTAPETPDPVTGSVETVGSLGYAGSDRSDWDLIRSTVSASLSSPSTAHVEWANRATGNSGTISELASSGTPKGRDCHSFASTIATVDGVRLYHAEICKSVMNTWEFSKIAAADVQ